MVVDDFDFRWAFRRPNKADSELVVDPDRVSPLPVTRQPFKSIAGRRPQVAQIACGVEVPQFPTRWLDESGGKALRTLAVEDCLGGLIPEAPDHILWVSLNDTAVKPARIDQ
jgi:hypothetical protein